MDKIVMAGFQMKLFEAGKIGKLSIKNRIVMAPMGLGGLSEPDGRLGERAKDYYVARAKGGVGLIITGTTRVTREIEYIPSAAGFLGADGSMYVSQLDELAYAVHDFGAKIAVQLTAGRGRLAPNEDLRLIGAVAPSPVPCFWNPQVIARELTIGEIESLVKAFGSAAERLRLAGIDAIELHAHNGYLLDQFQTALWNQRTDPYGGDLSGRLRFVLEIITAIKKSAGKDFPIIYRFSLTHYFPGGREVEEGLEIARRLEAAGIDAFHIDAGCYEVRFWASPPHTQPPAFMVDLAKKVKEVLQVPVITVGRLGYPEVAERVLQEGKADFIALGRALLADPDWPNKVREGRLEEIRPCIGCYEGCLERINKKKYVSCAVNPATGMEREFVIYPAEKEKSVLVVGGGPAGMEAARIAALRGHKVSIWERGKALGGNLIPASVPDFKKDYASLIMFLSTQLEKLGVTVHLEKEVTPDLIKELQPDVLFIATGGVPIIPQIPGIERRNVATAIDILEGKKEVGDSVIIIGGGLMGCETALHLANQGKRTTVVEVLDSVARDMFFVNRMHLLELLSKAGTKILAETQVLEIVEEGVWMVDKKGMKSLVEGKTVVIAVGLKPNRELSNALKQKAREVYFIGDCVEPRKVMNAIWEGFRMARLV